jgi:hypothetical protein
MLISLVAILRRVSKLIGKSMKLAYDHTQFSVLFTTLFGFLVLLMLFLMLVTGFRFISVFLFIFFVACLITFTTLTVQVDAERVRLYFGVGAPRKTLPLQEIQNLRVVQNSPLLGWGIHWFPFGWIYNVGGFEAVEIELKDGRRLRIGSDEAEALARAIENALISKGKGNNGHTKNRSQTAA